MSFSRSDSGEALSPEEEPRAGLLAAVARALRAGPPLCQPAPAPLPHTPHTPHTPHAVDDDRSRMSDDNDNSADLLDSETEPCLVTDPGIYYHFIQTIQLTPLMMGDTLLTVPYANNTCGSA